jgi:hypothetical protein
MHGNPQVTLEASIPVSQCDSLAMIVISVNDVFILSYTSLCLYIKRNLTPARISVAY